MDAPAPSTTLLQRHACRCRCSRAASRRWHQAALVPPLLAAVTRSDWRAACALPASFLDVTRQVQLLGRTEAAVKDMLGSRVARQPLQAL